LKDIIQEMIEQCDEVLPKILAIIKQVFEHKEELQKVWISKNNLSRLSNHYLKDRKTFSEKGIALNIFKEKKTGEDRVSIPDYISLADLRNILESIEYISQSDIEEEKREYFFKSHRENMRN
jgi:hypothetical protein